MDNKRIKIYGATLNVGGTRLRAIFAAESNREAAIALGLSGSKDSIRILSKRWQLTEDQIERDAAMNLPGLVFTRQLDEASEPFSRYKHDINFISNAEVIKCQVEELKKIDS